MAEESIDRISVEISSDAGAAVRNLNNLVTALGDLEGKVGSSAAKLLQLSSALNSLKRSAAGFDAAGLKQLGEVKFSATVPKNLNSLVNTLNAMPADSAWKLMGISNGLRGLGNVSLGKGAVGQIAKIPAIVREFSNFNTGAFSAQLRELNAQLAPLASNIDRLAAAYAKLPKSMQTAGLAARSVASSNKYLQTSNTALVASNAKVATSLERVAASAKGAIAKVAGLTAAFQAFKRGFEATVGNVNTYIENMNLFEASMGRYAESAAEFGQKVQDALGVDFADWARNQGVFQTLITGMGDTADRAAVMSQQLTQLGYDIASFYNISVEDAMLKLQSGMAGELEPLRRLGWDLSNARMQLEATELGIEGNVQEMTQAEKVGLRYHLIMTQVTQTHGDMARTIASPANQLRVLQAQLSLAARAVGNLFIPALNMILPVVISAVKAIRLLAQTIANFLGIDASFEVDYSSLDTSGIATGGVDDLADALDDSGDAAEKARKKVQAYKNTVMGFDELNKLNPENDTGSSDSGSGESGPDASGAGGIDLPLETYDFLSGLSDRVSQLTDDMAQKILGLLPAIGLVGAALLGWKLADLVPGLGTLADKLKFVAGFVLAVAGAAMLAYYWLDAWNNGVNLGNLVGMLGGIALLVAGLALMFGKVGAAIGLVVGGVALFALGVKGALEDSKLDWQDLGLAIGGIALVVGGLALAFGPVGAAIGAVIGFLALLVLGFNDLMTNGFSPENFAAISLGFIGIGAVIGALIGGPIGALIGAAIGAVAAIVTAVVSNWDWLCENVFSPIASFFGELWDSIVTTAKGCVKLLQMAWGAVTGFFGSLWNGIAAGAGELWGSIVATGEGCVKLLQMAWGAVTGFFSGLWGGVKSAAQGAWSFVSGVWKAVSGWFGANVIRPVSGFFSGLWGGIKGAAQGAWSGVSSAWRAVSGWFNSTVIAPVKNAFSSAWGAITSGASAAWGGVMSAFSGLASFFGGIFSDAWAGIMKVFQVGGDIFKGVTDNIVNAFKWIVNRLIRGINWVVARPFNRLNSIIAAMRGWEILEIKPFAGFHDVPVPQIPYLAEGRYGIDAGQLFVARERGAEMVGSMSGHTTVANNQQIVEGIEAGVTRAMLRAMSVQGGSGGEARIEIPLVIGNEEIARAVWRGELSLVRRGELKPQFT